MVYHWKPFSGLRANAQAVGEALEQTREENGVLTPAVVVVAAWPIDSPLHPCFEWDDALAATRYREDQARYVLRHIAVEMEVNSEMKTLRAFVNVSQDGDTAYTSLAVAMSDKALREQVVQRAWRELGAWRDRYREYDELAGVFSAMEKARSGVASRRKASRGAARQASLG